MDRVSETIEALADSLVASRPDRNTIVKTLNGFRRYVLNEAENQKLEMNVATSQYLDAMFGRWKNGQDPDQR